VCPNCWAAGVALEPEHKTRPMMQARQPHAHAHSSCCMRGMRMICKQRTRPLRPHTCVCTLRISHTVIMGAGSSRPTACDAGCVVCSDITSPQGTHALACRHTMCSACLGYYIGVRVREHALVECPQCTAAVEPADIEYDRTPCVCAAPRLGLAHKSKRCTRLQC
jgi:hypothetical protein